MTTFVANFRARLTTEHRYGPELDTTLQAVLALARAAWPRIDVDEPEFAAHLANVIVDGTELLTNLRTRHVSDLYLAFGCACGDRRALAALETHYIARLRAPLLRIGIPASALDETMQLIRVEVLVAQLPRLPRILGYGAHGRLQGWLHAVGVRTGLRYLRKAHDYQSLEDDHVELGTGLELEYMQRKYGDAFRKAFATAVAGLAPDDRLLLKQRFQHRTGVEDLGRHYGVHAATITRRVQSARDVLVTLTHTVMMRELSVGAAELASILRLIHSQVDLTLSDR